MRRRAHAECADRKQDVADCRWIAELHEYGLLRPSFIPAAEVAGLRQRTRYRKKLIEQRSGGVDPDHGVPMLICKAAST
jgi:hypothetical protein